MRLYTFLGITQALLCFPGLFMVIAPEQLIASFTVAKSIDSLSVDLYRLYGYLLAVVALVAFQARNHPSKSAAYSAQLRTGLFFSLAALFVWYKLSLGTNFDSTTCTFSLIIASINALAYTLLLLV
jgi:hypothetical protein